MRLSNKPTIKQLDYIADIEEMTGEKFEGETKGEAAKWINDHICQYKLAITDSYVLSRGYF